MSTEAPELSIVTGTRNRLDLLAEMVASVLEHTELSFELLIGDGSDSEYASFDDPRVQVFPEEEPLGSVRGYNELFKRARADLVCYLNDDLVVLPGWSRRILDVFRQHPEVDLACIPLIEPDEPRPFIALYHSIPYAQMGVLRRQAGEALGWFDERYRAYGPDPDLAMRLIASGRRLAPIYGAVVEHLKVEDDPRESNSRTFESDNAELHRLWYPRRYEIRRKYRKRSFRYFEGFDTRPSESYGCSLLTVPESPDSLPEKPLSPHVVKRRKLKHLVRSVWPGAAHGA